MAMLTTIELKKVLAVMSKSYTYTYVADNIAKMWFMLAIADNRTTLSTRNDIYLLAKVSCCLIAVCLSLLSVWGQLINYAWVKG